MAEETARILIKRGKIASAAFVLGVCRSSSPCAVTEEIFNSVLNPTVPIHDGDLIDWCRWLIAGGQTPEEFFQTVKKYDNATTCGLVWTANFVAYRCRTCGISPCMSLCSECFQKGNHEGHDFNMFRSQAGGACDCGDKGVMKESGFCQRHGAQNASNRQEAPHDLLCVAEVLMPRLLLRLVQHLRVNYESDRLFLAPHMADSFLTLLQTHSEMGAAMRGVMTKALLDQESYFRLAILGDYENKYGLSQYLTSRKLITGDETPSVGALNESITNRLKESSFLDELIFWVIQYEFPQKLVCLLLNMMPDLAYKEAFTKLFVSQYDRLAVMLATSEFCELLSNRVVHVSVQLFSNEALAVHMTRHHRLLQTMVSCLIKMMSAIAQKSILQNHEKNSHSVVNCSHHIMKEHCYWPLVSDLNNVFTHAGVAHEFLNDLQLMRSWFKFISLFQGMNVNEREVKVHVEFESNTYYAAFTAELEGCATPMWALISHLKSEDCIDKTKRVLSVCLEYLNIWFSDIIFLPGDEINPLQVTFHLPLHRCFASFLGLAVRQQGVSMDSILPPDETLKLMMMHPLQAQVSFHEILCNMWVRNGLQIKGQAMTYIQSHFCNSVVDADLFLLQISAMKLDPDWYLQTVMQRFHVWEWFTFHPTRNNTFLDADKVLPLLEGALSFLCTLLSTRTNIGESEEETIRQEMVSLLCMGDKTHSQLMELLPDKCGEPPMTQLFETVLNEVADYRAPNFEATGAMMQGMYVPKPKVWEDEYNPIHVLLRAVHRRDYQSSLDRYTEYLRQNNKLSGSRPPWPPFRIPAPVFKEFQDLYKILHCKTMHGIIFTILHRAVYDPDIPEQILSFCIYLLDMAVRFSPSEAPSNKPQEPKEVEDLKFEGWFDGGDTLQNVTQEISSIVITEKVVMSMRMVEEMEVDEEAEEVDVQLVEGYYDVHSPEMDNPIVVEEHVLMEPAQSFPELPPSNTPLALPAPSVSSSSSSKCTQLVPFAGNGMVVPSTSSEQSPPMPVMSVPPLAITAAMVAAADSTSGNDDPGGYNMALVPTAEGPTTLRPKCMKLKQVPGRHSLLLSDKGLPLAIGACESDACTGLQRYHSFSNKRTIYIRESILSLLLRLYSKLSESPDSYKPQPVLAESKSRIGDDIRFLQRILDRIVASGQDKQAALQRTRERLWPQEKDVNMSPPSDRMETIQDRRRRARDRQRKLIAEFASKQKAFMQKTMETEFKEEILVTSLGNPAPEAKKEYECVICSQMSPSEEDRPVGLVVLLQATSVLGHCHQNPDRKLPCDDDLQHFNQGMDRITLYGNRTRFLTTNFIPLTAPMALNIGWEGGVHVQTCGHYLHIDCHKSYVQSLMNQNQMSSRLQNLSVENGEYFCPLCRQLANSVIPLRPDLKGPPVQFSERSLSTLVLDVRNLLATPFSESDSNILKKYMGGIMEDLTNATLPQCRSIPSPSPGNLYLFVCSIARTNLELEMVQRKFLYEPSKKSCLVPLLNVLSLHSILLMKTQNEGKDMGYAATMWRGLAEACQEKDPSHSPVPFNTMYHDQVPLLMRDPIALLIQLVLALPLNMDKVIFQCVVQMVYNLAHVQSLVSLSQKLAKCLRNRLVAEASHIDNEMSFCLKSLCSRLSDGKTFLGYVIQNVLSTYQADSGTDELQEISNPYIEGYVQNYTIHFLKIAALLQSHLYKEDIMLKTGDNEFQVMCSFLGLKSLCASPELLSASLVKWSVDPRLVINIWCRKFKKCISVTEMNANESLHPVFRCHPPALLRLPHNYDAIFKYYHKKCCTFCHKSPKDPSVCLVCGVMVCLREKCCREQYQYEAVKHSVVCGAGTAIYLAVNSSTIIVIRGKRACLWGSVYLDSYGEEDRDLKRGKPLYLSEDRYRLLQQQWINHSFDHTNKRWVWHKDNL